MKYWISLQLLLADGVYCVVQIPDQLLARLGNKETRWLLNVPWPLVACRVRRRGRRRRRRSFHSVCPSDLPLDREAECDGVRDPPLCRGRWHHTHTYCTCTVHTASVYSEHLDTEVLRFIQVDIELCLTYNIRTLCLKLGGQTLLSLERGMQTYGLRAKTSPQGRV